MTITVLVQEAVLINTLKIFISIGIGWFLGKERKKQNQNGGSRTFAIISLSACLLAILSLSISNQYNFDFTRPFGYALAGIGFLASGMISKIKNHIEGLTSSATLFCLLPINFLIGLGFYYYGILSAFLIYIILESKYIGVKNDRKIK